MLRQTVKIRADHQIHRAAERIIDELSNVQRRVGLGAALGKVQPELHQKRRILCFRKVLSWTPYDPVEICGRGKGQNKDVAGV